MNRLRFLFLMAWREGRASRRRLAVLAAGVAAGVAALVAVNAFADNVRDSVARQAQALLGADLRLRAVQPFPDSAVALIDSIAATPGASLARVTTFGAMALAPRTGGVRPVTVTAIEGAFPFYGAPLTSPAGLWPGIARGDRAVLVDSALLGALEARPGDTLVLGNARLPIAGTLARYPGDVSLASGFSPRVVMPALLLDEIGLLGFGSRAEYEAFLRIGSPAAAQGTADALRPRLEPMRVRIRSAAEAQEDTAETFDRLGRFLGLVALVAVLLGGLGTASAVRVLIAQKLDTVAVLRCLGASTRLVFAIYLVQSALLGAAGGLLGGLLGLGLQLLLPRLLTGFFPVDIAVEPGWTALATGIAAGIWVSCTFALIPLLAIRRIAPLGALRRSVEPAKRRDPARWVAGAVVATSVALAGWWQAGEWRPGFAYAAAVGAALLVLWLVALGLVKLLRRRRTTARAWVWRQGIANLHRPGNQTVAVVMALGFGTYLLATLVTVQHNLLRRFRVGDAAARANVVLFDIQADQLPGVLRILDSAGVAVGTPVPIVPMRIRAIDGTPVRELPDTLPGGEERADWAVRREYRSTHRDTLTAGEQLVEGRWNPRRDGTREPADSGVARIAVERELATELGVGLGSRITWDVQGVAVETEITAVREVDWARFEPNFFVVFERGVLDSAPQTWVTLAAEPDPARRGRLQRTVVERHANVAVIDVTQVVARIQEIVDRVVFAIRFLATFSLVTGIIVLAGAIAASRMARIRESALLRTLGATRRQLLDVAAAEFTVLGGLAALAGTGLALVAGWLLALRVFETPYGIPALPLLGLAALVVVLTVVGGLLQAAAIARRTAREALATE